MSVLIKMDMPKSCPCELVGVGYDLYCSFASGSPARVKEYDECCRNNTRPAWCPLSEVPAHGRLIDADLLLKSEADYEHPLFDTDGSWDCVVLCYDRETIKSASTVIEAEE